jgi:hypothetical protein
MRLNARWVFVVLLYALAGVAQQPVNGGSSGGGADKSPASGAVTGRVFLDDSKEPARKATVYLQPAAELQSDAPNDRNNRQGGGAGTMGVETGFDGSFSFSHVAYGSYYVVALYPGYVSPYVAISLAEARSSYGTQQPLEAAEAKAKERALSTIPRVTVQSDQPASIEVGLERGGAISGNVSYDDGSPAIGLRVDILARMLQDGKETWGPFNSFRGNMFGQIRTDDRGNYRISGLPEQKYVVQVILDPSETITYISSGSTSTSSTGNSSQLIIYSGNTPRLKNAAPLTVGLSEERTGADIRIPMSKFHKVSGFFVSAHDGHVINSGQVLLLSADDKSMAGQANSTQNNPGFTLNFVLDGEYVLESPASADVDYQLQPQQPGSSSPPQYDGHPTHLYGSASIPLHVSGDMDGVTIAVPEPTAKEAEALADALRQQGGQTQSPQ